MSLNLPAVSHILGNLRRITRHSLAVDNRVMKSGDDVEHVDGGRGYILNILATACWEEYRNPNIRDALREIYNVGEPFAVMVAWYGKDGKEASYNVHAPYLLVEVSKAEAA